MVYFSGGEDFKKLWADIPTVSTYFEYCGLANEIEDYHGDHVITDFDKQILLDTLDRWAQAKGLVPRADT